MVLCILFNLKMCYDYLCVYVLQAVLTELSGTSEAIQVLNQWHNVS
jgi:hypothetical protein